MVLDLSAFCHPKICQNDAQFVNFTAKIKIYNTLKTLMLFLKADSSLLELSFGFHQRILLFSHLPCRKFVRSSGRLARTQFGCRSRCQCSTFFSHMHTYFSGVFHCSNLYPPIFDQNAAVCCANACRCHVSFKKGNTKKVHRMPDHNAQCVSAHHSKIPSSVLSNLSTGPVRLIRGI